MEKSESVKRFLRKEVAAASAGFMHKAMTVFQVEYKADTVGKFIEELKEGICDENICFLQIALVYHKTLLKEQFYQLQGFGPDFYLSPPLYKKDLDWDWMYQPYYEFCQKVSDESKKYVMQIQKTDLDEICILELDETKRMVRHLLTEATPHLLKLKDLCILGAKKKLQIQLSDYMGSYEPLFTFDHHSEVLGEWMNGILQDHSSERI